MSALQFDGLFIPNVWYPVFIVHVIGLIVRVRRYMGTFHLILYVLDIFQVLLDVQNLKKLEKYTNFISVFLFFCDV